MTPIDVNREAPVGGAAEAYIEAPIETVWRVLSDLEKWPAWNNGVSKIRVGGPIEVGTSFEWVGGGFKIVSRLEEVEPPARIGWRPSVVRQANGSLSRSPRCCSTWSSGSRSFAT